MDLLGREHFQRSIRQLDHSENSIAKKGLEVAEGKDGASKVASVMHERVYITAIQR